jgi:hypothetical protein
MWSNTVKSLSQVGNLQEACSVPLHCKVICSSAAVHLYQLYTGFGELAASGLIELELERSSRFSSSHLGRCVLEAVVDGSVKIAFDTQDSPHLDQQVDLSNTHVYYKRTLLRGASLPPCSCAFEPLGLNYCVLTRNSVMHQIKGWARGFGGARAAARCSEVISRVLRITNSMHTCRQELFEKAPRFEQNTKVLFMSRLWDPARAATKEKRTERIGLNRMRIECVRALRKRFGDQFIGGLERERFAMEQAPDCALPAAKSHYKGDYLRLLASADIGIQTTGLEGSIGWKLAEYVAGSKAIVSEKIRHVLPGHFEPGKNYLEFETPEGCVAQVEALLCRPSERYAMMLENQRYYHAFVRPDILVWNSLMAALQE